MILVKTRRDMRNRLFAATGGKEPYQWQLDVAEALLLGVDAIVIAPTGAGKSIHFAIPLLLDGTKILIILYPLIALQEDQAKRFTGLGISAAVVNGETWSEELAKVRTVTFAEPRTSCN